MVILCIVLGVLWLYKSIPPRVPMTSSFVNHYIVLCLQIMLHASDSCLMLYYVHVINFRIIIIIIMLTIQCQVTANNIISATLKSLGTMSLYKSDYYYYYPATCSIGLDSNFTVAIFILYVRLWISQPGLYQSAWNFAWRFGLISDRFSPIFGE